MKKNQNTDFVKKLLTDVDFEIQLMHGKNIRMFNTPQIKSQVIDLLKDSRVNPKLLKATPSTVKKFERGVRMGMAIAHFKHTARARESPEDFAIRNLQQFFSLSANTLLTNTKFQSYRKYYFNIMASYIDKQTIENVNKFLKSIKRRELYALGQRMLELNSKLRKLHNVGKRITSGTIDNYKEIYDLCCSCIETYLKILYGIKEASQGAAMDYGKVKKTQIYDIKKKLVNSNQDYKLLLKPFSTIIWNADKHTGTIKYPSRKKIEFMANEGRRWKEYDSFIQLTKEICSITFLLSRYGQAIILILLEKSSLKQVTP